MIRHDDLIHINICNFTDQDFTTFTSTYRSVLNDVYERKIYIIFDTNNLTYISPYQTAKFVTFLFAMRSPHRNKLKKFAIVVTNEKIKQILDYVFIIVPPVVPYIIETNVESATIKVKQEVHL